MRRALMALLVLLAAAPAVEAHDALEVIDGCVTRLDPGLDVGFDKIAARCPELAPSLARGSWSAWLPQGWDQADNGLSVDGLRALRALIVTESRRVAAAHAADTGHVAAVLAAVALPAPRHESRWQRFKAWLREALQARSAAPERSWLGRLLEALGRQGPWVLIASGALALVALVAATLIVSALRDAGLLSWPRAAAARVRADAVGAAMAARQRLEAAAPPERPRLLLELIAARLAEQERLPPARALTLQELVRAAQLAPEDRERLAALSAVCERLTFSGRGLGTHELSGALERGRELLDALEATAA